MAPRVSKVKLVRKVFQDFPDSMEIRVKKERLAQQVNKDLKESPV